MTKVLVKAMKKAKNAWEKDRDHLVRLDGDFLVGRLVESFRYGEKDLPVLDWRCEDFSIVDRTLTLYARPKPICDGATLAPDRLAGVDIAPGYLPHDYLYTHLDEMAADEAWKAAGWTKESLRTFFDAILGNMIDAEERKKGKAPWRSRLYHAGVRLFGGIAHRLGLSTAVLALAVAGCTIPTAIEPSGEEPAYTVVKKSAEAVNDAKGENVESGGAVADAPAGEPPAPPVALDFRYGGFRGERAKEEPGCRIGSLKVGKDKLTYKWEAGGCEALGAKDKADYSQTVACAFYWDGKKWVGGKFDWISTSRTSRGFENIKSGYNGWDSAAFFGAKKHGFCIVSKDGKKRSNFIEE
jgi:hypothetical protein